MNANNPISITAISMINEGVIHKIPGGHMLGRRAIYIVISTLFMFDGANFVFEFLANAALTDSSS